MLVSPLPVLSLVILVQVAEIVVRIAMGFHRPLIVENDFVVVPAMSIMVVRGRYSSRDAPRRSLSWPGAVPMNWRSSMLL